MNSIILKLPFLNVYVSRRTLIILIISFTYLQILSFSLLLRFFSDVKFTIFMFLGALSQVLRLFLHSKHFFCKIYKRLSIESNSNAWKYMQQLLFFSWRSYLCSGWNELAISFLGKNLRYMLLLFLVHLFQHHHWKKDFQQYSSYFFQVFPNLYTW